MALRFAKAGRPVVIGSRREERALATVDAVKDSVPGAAISGYENARAAASAPIVFLSVPFEHTADTIKAVRGHLKPGQIVVSMVVPLAMSIGDSPVRMLGVWQGSAAEMVASLVPQGVKVVSAFQNVSAHRLQALDSEVACDVIVSGPKGPRAEISELCELIPGLRAVDGGPLTNARIVEEITGLLIGLNIRYKAPEGFGFRITGLPK